MNGIHKIFILICILSNLSCNKQESYFGKEFNYEREQVGLFPLFDESVSLPIKKSTNGNNRLSRYYLAADSIYRTGKEVYWGKSTLFRNDTILSEIDMFVKIHIDLSTTDTIENLLSYAYFFTPYYGHKIGWKYSLYVITDNEYAQGGYIKKHEADSILTSWKLYHPQLNK